MVTDDIIAVLDEILASFRRSLDSIERIAAANADIQETQSRIIRHLEKIIQHANFEIER